MYLCYSRKKLFKRPILQFCAIQRKDCGQWALPGGMVDPGEKVSETLKREFMEEALNSLEASEGGFLYHICILY